MFLGTLLPYAVLGLFGPPLFSALLPLHPAPPPEPNFQRAAERGSLAGRSRAAASPLSLLALLALLPSFCRLSLVLVLISLAARLAVLVLALVTALATGLFVLVLVITPLFLARALLVLVAAAPRCASASILPAVPPRAVARARA